LNANSNEKSPEMKTKNCILCKLLLPGSLNIKNFDPEFTDPKTACNDVFTLKFWDGLKVLWLCNMQSELEMS